MSADKTAKMRKLFGTNGVRGRVNKELVPDFVLRFAMATGTYFKSGDLAVGCDGRVSGPLSQILLILGLQASDAKSGT